MKTTENIAAEITRGIGVWALGGIGAHKLTAIPGGLWFRAQFLPIRNGRRSYSPETMEVTIMRNPQGLYELEVWRKDGHTHFESGTGSAGLTMAELQATIFALDSDEATPVSADRYAQAVAA